MADARNETYGAPVAWDPAPPRMRPLRLLVSWASAAAAVYVASSVLPGFEIDATAYVGDAGRTALRIEADYDLSLTQRLILQPRFELNAYGKDDPAANIGSGISDAEFGLRLRYEIRREFAPYIGVERVQRFGRTADFARANDISAGETQFVVGLRLWY